MPAYVIVSEKSWHRDLPGKMAGVVPGDWSLVDSREEFTEARLAEIAPEWIFIPHWSHIIPASIYEKFRCVVFHMTDLPYGRGGSPLQNLIVAGHASTMISAIRVEAGIDEGDIYLKKPLSLEGSASEIFQRSALVIAEMMHEIIEKNIQPVPQQGTPVIFRRRKPADSDLKEQSDINKVYDIIRMLDCEGYPHAFLETAHIRLEFTQASLNPDNSINAHVRIVAK